MPRWLPAPATCAAGGSACSTIDCGSSRGVSFPSARELLARKCSSGQVAAPCLDPSTSMSIEDCSSLKAMEMKGGAMMIASVRDGRDVHVPIRLDKMICMLVVKGRANC
jgi:hypothetical protein